MEEKYPVCALCNCEMKPANAAFSYMGHTFGADVPRCPKCGQVYIPEELAEKRMVEAETEMEDK